MISKELLSEVIGRKIRNIYLENEEGDNFLRENEISYEYRIDMQGMGCEDIEKAINIYELAHKCKEWALDNRWIISTMPMLTEKKWRNTSVRLSHFYSAGKDRHLDGIYHNGRIEADTETEAIFKACQWILDNKDSK